MQHDGTPHSGQYADVYLDHSAGLARRYPRCEAERAGLPGHAAKLRSARESGLPAPELIAVHAQLPLGEAHSVMRLLPGVALRPTLPLGPDAQRQLANDLGALLGRLSKVDPSRWPEQGDWRRSWLDLASDVRQLVLPKLSPGAGRRALSEVDAAAELAHTAPGGFTHGDLGGANVLVDPDTGQLAGVLDWDSSGPGDPALDLAALSLSIPAPVAALVADLLPDHAEQQRRARVYSATLALQDAVFGLRAGDIRASTAGLARYLD